MKISDFFIGGDFNSFNSYCNEKGLFYLEDISAEDLTNFRRFRGVGKKKHAAIISKIEEIKLEFQEIKISDEDNFFVYNIDEFDLHEYEVNYLLDVLGVEERISETLTIDEIYNNEINLLGVENKTKKILTSLSWKLRGLKTPQQIIEEFLENTEDRELSMLTSRYEGVGNTLRDVGEAHELTHERVRQVTNKTARKLIKYLEKESFRTSSILILLSFDYPDINIISYDDFNYFVGEKNTWIMKILQDHKRIFIFNNMYKVAFLTHEGEQVFLSDLDYILELLPDIYTEGEEEEAFQSHYFSEGKLSKEHFLMVNGYQRKGKIIFSGLLTHERVFSLIFKNDLHKQVKMDDKSYDHIMDISKNNYGYEINSPLRSAVGSLQRSDNFILVGPNTYQLFNIEDYDLSLLNKCFDYCCEELANRNQMNILEVYNKYIKELNNSGINSKQHLYSILKYLYSDELDFGRRNTLNIYSNSSNKISNEAQLINFMNKQNGICTIKDIVENLKWTEQKITLTTSLSDEIIYWGNNTYKLVSPMISDNEINALGSILHKNFDEQGFITEGQLFKEAKFDQLLFPLIDNEGIDSSDKFRSVFRPYFKNLKGLQLLITPLNSVLTIEDIIVNKFQNGVTKDNLKNYLEHELFYKSASASQTIDSITSNYLMVEVEQDFYYPRENINISEEAINSLIKYIKNIQQNKPYIILKALVGYRSSLPAIDLEWTPYLIRQILLESGYKNIHVHNGDSRTDQLILLNESSAINNIDELIYLELNENYDGNWHESYIAQYLEKKGFINKKPYRNKLPKNIYSNSKLIFVDEIGTVKLGGD